MGEFKIGERVRGYGVTSGTLYTGAVIRGGGSLPNSECYIAVKTADGSPITGTRHANIKNVERIEEVSYYKNLIGLKPEPVAEPKFVAPFRSDGSSVIDANSHVVVKVTTGGHKIGAFSQNLPMSERYTLATVLAEALNEKFAAKVEDSKSPF